MTTPTEPTAPSVVTDDIGLEHASTALEQLVAADQAATRLMPKALAMLLHLIDIDAKQAPTASS